MASVCRENLATLRRPGKNGLLAGREPGGQGDSGVWSLGGPRLRPGSREGGQPRGAGATIEIRSLDRDVLSLRLPVAHLGGVK